MEEGRQQKYDLGFTPWYFLRCEAGTLLRKVGASCLKLQYPSGRSPLGENLPEAIDRK